MVDIRGMDVLLILYHKFTNLHRIYRISHMFNVNVEPMLSPMLVHQCSILDEVYVTHDISRWFRGVKWFFLLVIVWIAMENTCEQMMGWIRNARSCHIFLWDSYVILWYDIPSGKLTVCYWKWLFIVELSLKKWWFSIVFCMFTRGYGIIPYNTHGSWFPRVSLVKYNPGINIGQTPQQTLQYKLPARFPDYTNGSVDVNFKPNKGKISSHFGWLVFIGTPNPSNTPKGILKPLRHNLFNWQGGCPNWNHRLDYPLVVKHGWKILHV